MATASRPSKPAAASQLLWDFFIVFPVRLLVLLGFRSGDFHTWSSRQVQRRVCIVTIIPPDQRATAVSPALSFSHPPRKLRSCPHIRFTLLFVLRGFAFVGCTPFRLRCRALRVPEAPLFGSVYFAMLEARFRYVLAHLAITPPHVRVHLRSCTYAYT